MAVFAVVRSLLVDWTAVRGVVRIVMMLGSLGGNPAHHR